MRVLVTRPAAEAARWVDALRGQGIAAEALPLIAIGPAPVAPLRLAWSRLAGFRAAMFVSANAVRGFFRARGDHAWPQATRAWAPGPGTVEALRAAGLEAGQVDAPPADAGQFDSEALWPQVAAQVRAGDRVLLVRGAGVDGVPRGRDWLARQLAAAGAEAEPVAAYTRQPPAWTAAERAAAAAAGDGSLWLFSSSEAVDNLRGLLPEVAWAGARAIATHPRIADAARRLGFGQVRESRPTLPEVAASIESFR